MRHSRRVLPEPLYAARKSPRQTALVALALGLLVVSLARWGPDWPAQEFRATLAQHAGFVAWTDQWYGGLPVPGYSVLYPVFGAILGAGLTGVLAVTASAWVAARLLAARDIWVNRRFGLATAFGLAGSLLIGQVPFLLALAFGLGCLLAVQRGHPYWAAVLAATCSLTSPLAGAFLLLTGAAYAWTYGWRSSYPFVAAIAGIGVAALVGGASGPMPCPWVTPIEIGGFAAVTLLLAPREALLLRRWVVLYAIAGVAAFVVPNPIGGNVSRIGALAALPLTCYLLSPRGKRRLLLQVLVAAVPAVAWPLVPIAGAVAHGATDPTQNVSYYRGLLAFLHTQDPTAGRLEIPFTREHWESARVAPYFPLARGWERQTDLKFNEVLYDKSLTPAAYRAWLGQSAVSLVALPDAPLDSGGKAEAALLAHPPSYLVPVWHDANWQVWRVAGAQRLATGPGTLEQLRAASFTLRFAAAGDETVRVRQSPLWQVTDGDACLVDEPDGWLHVRALQPGRVTVRARVNMQLLTRSVSTCSKP